MDEEQTVEVPRAALVRILNRIDAITQGTPDYEKLMDAVYPDDLVVHFPPVDDTQGQE